VDEENLDEEDDGKELNVAIEEHNSRLYDADREPTRETLLDKLQELQNSSEEGSHVAEFDDRLLLVEGEFYHLESVAYEVVDLSTSRHLSIDALDMFDLTFKNKLSGDREFVSLSEAMDAFIEDVEESES
jgi:hypothetical protein